MWASISPPRPPPQSPDMSSSGSDMFQSAVAYINNLPASANVSTTIQLQLYAAYKCVTTGILPTTSRPSFFDMAGRAKWDSWDNLGKSLQDEVDPIQAAEERYIQQARDLGWSESRDPTAGSSGPSAESSKGGAKGGGGMGIYVSVPAAPEETDTEHPVHGYAVKGDVEGLKVLLHQQPELVNLRDEFEYTPLHLAADRGHLEVVRLLLSKGADVRLKDQDGDTSLEIAEAAKREDIAQLLREHSNSSD